MKRLLSCTTTYNTTQRNIFQSKVRTAHHVTYYNQVDDDFVMFINLPFGQIKHWALMSPIMLIETEIPQRYQGKKRKSGRFIFKR